MDLTTDRLQALAISAVTKYMTKQASMSDAVASEARAADLNPEQVKRLIEASNSVAYLRQLKDSPDKTFEFPVAEYKDVLASLVGSSTIANDSGVKDTVQTVEKQATLNKEALFDFSEQEKVAMVAREVVRVKGQLTKMAYDKEEAYQRLVESAGHFKKEANALEKIAFVVDEADFEKVAKLAGFEKSAQRNTGLLFTDADLKTTRNMYGLLKEAEALVNTEKELQELEKRAILGLLARGVGMLASKPFKMAGNLLTNAPKNALGISKSVSAGNSARQAEALAKGLDPKKVTPFTKADAHAAWKADAKTLGTEAATQKHGFKSTALNRMSFDTKLTLATAPMMAVPGASAWDRLHGQPKAPELP